MKLILTNEVTGLGEPGDVVQVKDGYGRNYLLPRGYAMSWTRGAQKQIDAIRRARKSREIADLGEAQNVADRLADLRVSLHARSGASGRLFGAVTAADIVDAVRQVGGPALDRRRIEVGKPIKTLGSHQVQVRVHPEVTARLNLDVIAG